MAGGEHEHVDRCRPVFESFADRVIHLGPLGSGQMAKLVNNLVFTAQVSLALATFTFAAGLHMDPRALARVLAHGSGGSRAAAILAASQFDHSGLRQSVATLQKDVGIVLDVARRRQAPQPPSIMDLAQRALRTLVQQGEAPSA